MLPEMDGLALVKVARGAGLAAPILFLTTMGGLYDRVEGLEADGDDYLVKRFAFAELAPRVAALARRPPRNAQFSILRIADLEMDCVTRVFGRFVRLNASRPGEGHGLSLAMVKAVADLHGIGLTLSDAGPGLRVSMCAASATET